MDNEISSGNWGIAVNCARGKSSPVADSSRFFQLQLGAALEIKTKRIEAARRCFPFPCRARASFDAHLKINPGQL